MKISITTQTLPTNDELFIYLSFGVRRWMPIRGTLAFDHGHSVYLAPTVPYLTGLDNSRHFGRARIRLTRSANTDGKSVYVPQLDDALAAVLREAGCLSRLPDPSQLVDKPMDYLQREGDAIGLVYSTGMLQREKVSAGLSLADRKPLVTWVAQTLTPHLSLLDPLPRADVKVYKGLSKAADVSAQAATLPHAIHDVVGPRLNIELFTDTAPATMYALEALSTRLGTCMPTVDQLGDQESLIDIGPLTVAIRRPASAGITANLNRAATNGKGNVQGAVEARIAEIGSAVPKAAHPTIALVEIAHPDSYQGSQRGADPIFAVRHGLLLTGRLSQFITPAAEPKRLPRVREGRQPSDANRERFTAAVDDLFRQLGVRPELLPQPTADTIERQPALLAVWLIRQNKGRSGASVDWCLSRSSSTPPAGASRSAPRRSTEDVPRSVELWWRPGDHQAASTVSS